MGKIVDGANGIYVDWGIALGCAGCRQSRYIQSSVRFHTAIEIYLNYASIHPINRIK